MRPRRRFPPAREQKSPPAPRKRRYWPCSARSGCREGPRGLSGRGGRAGVAENSMDPSDPDAAASQGRKRVKPPVIELEATDVTPEGPKPQRGTSEEHQEESEDRTGNGKGRSASANNARNRRALPILSGFIGLLVGALALALVFLFVRGGSLADIGGRAGGSDPAIGATGERVDQLLKIVAELE